MVDNGQGISSCECDLTHISNLKLYKKLANTLIIVHNYIVTGSINGERVGQLAIICRCNFTVFSEAVKKCCYADEVCKVAFVGVSRFSIRFSIICFNDFFVSLICHS